MNDSAHTRPTAPETPDDDRPDWATVCAWIDAGQPDLNPDGTWSKDTP